MVKVLDNVEQLDVEAVNAKENRTLYAKRIKIFPKRVVGTFRNLKWWVMGLTLAIYYITPWIRWDRGPHAPDQAVLVDLANRRFYFFNIEIWPQEFYYIAGLLILAGIGLFLVTSSVGRAWCGYACPQTVWVDLYIAVERWIEGDRNARIKLDKSSWTGEKIRKYALKHFIWIVIAFSTGGAWIFYFSDAPSLLVNFWKGNLPFVGYATVGVLTATTYIFAGFAREQICTFACPWPRIQGAMLDEHSLVVTYQSWRGEPRTLKKKERERLGDKAGDCVDCNACVAVCPQGIDIRDGEQLECITCALCIDACNAVMDKIGKPRGLITYATLADQSPDEKGSRNETTWRSFIRPRTFVYAGVFVFISLALLVTLLMRDRLDMSVLHDRNPQYVTLSDGSIRNGYTLKILNMIPQPRTFILSAKGLEGATMTVAGSDKAPAGFLEVKVGPDKLRSLRVYVTVNKSRLSSSQTPLYFTVEDTLSDEVTTYKAVFEGPRK
jgi:cytochrome c oxidase accessory protein FixG